MNKEITASYLEEMLLNNIREAIKESFKEYNEGKNNLYLKYTNKII